MVRLSETWLSEPLFDFEYKSYQLLAYSHYLTERFSEKKFYPYLTDLLRHMERIHEFKLAKESLEDTLKRELVDLDLNRLELVRASVEDPSGLMAEIKEIVDYADGMMKRTHHLGSEGLSEVIGNIQISPVGIVIDTSRSGYLFFRKTQATRIYHYTIRLVQRPQADEQYMDVVTRFVAEIATGMFTNFNDVKWKVIKEMDERHVCNVYLVETNTDLPQFETLLPVAKNYIKTQAG